MRNKSIASRVVGRPFKKGQSGNPGGRPKEYRNVVALAQRCTEAAIVTLAQIMRNGENESARVRSAEILLDRGWGRAPFSGQVRVDGEVTVRRAEDLTDDELAAVIAGEATDVIQ